MKPSTNVTSATVNAANHGVPHSGQLIGDRYRLDRPLERGAMGSVWRAEQVRLRAPVAVKFLDPSLIGDRQMHDRFIQEARSAAAVRSAHVVQVFDYGSEGGMPYIAMELLDGENLDARLGMRGTLTPAELAKLFAELARGIGQAHAIGVIHRDLKPGNIFIAREGEHEVTKIVDFGIAKVKATAFRLTQGIGTQLGTLLGTPQYMSPEQVRGSSSIDHRTDLWALAVIACECLTGRCPFSGATIGDLTVQICTERPPAPSSLGPVPPGFDQWFFKAIQKKANKRFQSVEEMAERLQAVLGPAILTAPGAARAGRLITFPSRSEVRLAYSAVVTWKGYVMNRLSERCVALRQTLLWVARYLAIPWHVARQRLHELLESERLRYLRPMLERHGMLASVALLGGGILLLGLTARSADPNRGSPGPANVTTAEATPSTNPTTLGAIAAPRPEVMTDALDRASAPTPSPVERGPDPATEVPSSVSTAAPGRETLNVAVPAPGARALDLFVVPKAAAEKAEEEAVNKAPERAAAPRVRARAITRNAPDRREPSGSKPGPANGEKAAASANATPVPKTRMTRAMTQAAAKILEADDRVPSVPDKKPAPRETAPRPARPAKPVIDHPR
jgi:eukaryotic-like serine/threonine-protein kinase